MFLWEFSFLKFAACRFMGSFLLFPREQSLSFTLLFQFCVCRGIHMLMLRLIPDIAFYSCFSLNLFLSPYLTFYVSIPAHPSIPSYTVKYTIAAGTLFIKCGVNPPYNPATPSSLKTVMKHLINPLYFLF